MRKQDSNAVPRCQQIRKGIGGPIVSSMDENAGTKASPCFRNHCWSGLRRHPRNRAPVEKLQASSQRSLAIHWTHKRGHRKTLTLSKLDGALGSFISTLRYARREFAGADLLFGYRISGKNQSGAPIEVIRNLDGD